MNWNQTCNVYWSDRPELIISCCTRSRLSKIKCELCDEEFEQTNGARSNLCEKCLNDIELNKTLFRIPPVGNEEIKRKNLSFVDGILARVTRISQ